MPTLSYRNASPSDLERIVEIYNSTVSSRMSTADTEPVTIESRRKWFEDHNPKNRPLWIIESEERQIIGWLSFQSFYGRPAYEATAEISLYIDAAYRGKGMGNEIMQYCLAKVPELGIKTLLAYVFSHNLPSIKLLLRHGFQEWGTLPDIAVLDGQERSVTILGRRI